MATSTIKNPNDVGFQVGDTILIPFFNQGYAAKATEFRFYINVPRLLPPATIATYEKDFTISAIKNCDGGAVSLPSSPTVEIGRSSDYCLQVKITNMSGLTAYKEGFAMLDGTVNRQINIIAKT